MNKKKIGIVVLLVLAFAGAGFFWWSQGSADRAQEKMDLAVKYISQNNFEKAILAYDEAIKIDPKAADAYMGLAKVYALQGQYDKAQATYEKGLAKVEIEDKNTLQLGLGGMYIDQGKTEEAKKSFEAIIDENPACLEAYWGLAIVYQQQGDNSQAEELLRQAAEKNPNEYRSYNMLALFLSQNGEKDQAFENLVKSLSLELNQQEAYLLLKDLFEADWSQLSAQASSVSDQKTADMLIFYSYYAAEDYPNAVNTFESKLSDQTDNHKAQILAAIAMNKSGNAGSGKELIDQLANKKVDGWLLSDIAEYYLAAGDKEKARFTAINALEAHSTNLEAVALLQRLNTNDEDGKMYAAKYLLYNWKPLAEVKQILANAAIRFSPLNADADIINYLHKQYPELMIEDLQSFDKIVADITGDKQDEIILTGSGNGGRAFVLQPKGESYQILYTNDNNYRPAVIDKFRDLVLTSGGDGTGCVSYSEDILRWNGHQFQKIWSGMIKNELYRNADNAEMINENGSYTISGNKKPEKLRYVVTGHDEEKILNIVKEYRFDEKQFKFVEVSSASNNADTSSKLPDNLFLFRGISVGMDENQVIGLIGDTPYKNGKLNGTAIWEYMNGTEDFKILFSDTNHKVVTMWVNENDAGIKNGDPYEKVTNAYGAGQTEPAYEFGDYFLSYQKDKNKKIIFTITGGQVTSILIGENIMSYESE